MAPHTAERKSQLQSLLSATPRNFSRTVGGAGGGRGVFGGAASQLRYPAMPEAATPMSAAPADRGFAGFFGLCTPPAKDRESRGVSTAETPTLDSRLAESYQCACALYHGDGQLPARAAAVLMGAPCVAQRGAPLGGATTNGCRGTKPRVR